MKEMQQNAQEAAAFLKSFASQHRLAILCALTEGEKNVTELMEIVGLPQTSMSQHLAKLKSQNIVTFRREHRSLYYYICDDKAEQLLSILHGFFCEKDK